MASKDPKSKTTKKTDSKKKETASSDQPAAKQIAINAQYVKDLSFESPRAPQSLMEQKERPNIDVNIDVKAANVGENLYEVILTLSATAKVGDDALFVAEVAYAGVFTLMGVEQEEIEPALLIYCPNILFPFARRVVADITRDGSFPPLMLDPIDFGALYVQRKQHAEQQQASA